MQIVIPWEMRITKHNFFILFFIFLKGPEMGIEEGFKLNTTIMYVCNNKIIIDDKFYKFIEHFVRILILPFSANS